MQYGEGSNKAGEIFELENMISKWKYQQRVRQLTNYSLARLSNLGY